MIQALAITAAELARFAIPWRDLSAIPDDRKDGLDVLLWAGRPLTGIWVDEWCDTVLGQPIAGATHWADVEGPNHA